MLLYYISGGKLEEGFKRVHRVQGSVNETNIWSLGYHSSYPREKATLESFLLSFTSPTFSSSLNPFSSSFVSDLTTCLYLSCPCHLLVYPQGDSNLTGLPLRGCSMSFQDPFPIIQPES